jgi:GNAT superfamily N-acetyltransferase
MNIDITRVEISEILPLRELYRQAMNCQIVKDSFARRGFSDAYLIRDQGAVAGYGLVARHHEPDSLHELYLVPQFEAAALPIVRQLLAVSSAKKIVTQTNDRLLLLMLYDCTTNITSETILFGDAYTTNLQCSTGKFRKVTEADKARLFEHKHEPGGDWMIECDGVPVATGGALFHYNPPYGDLYMEVHEAYRRRGFGSYLLQEVKSVCYEMGKIPAAGCNVSNTGSRRSLEKAGMLPCARILLGEVR